MKAKDIIKDILGLRKMSQATLAEKAGFKSQSNVTGILNRNSSLRVDNFVQMLSAMGCEVVVRDLSEDGKEWKVDP